jgi:hypothetical protein
LRYLLIIVFASLLAVNCQAQKEITAAKVRFMIQGHWVSDEDSNYTLTVAGDTLLETKRGVSAQYYDYKITKESCDPDVDKKAKGTKFTGFYIDENSNNNGVEYCNMLITMTDSVMILLYTDGELNFKKMPVK